MAERILIIGGGISGCYAAAILADRGWDVTLLERAARLGGRATTFHDRPTGSLVEIGPHLIMGCYAATKRFAHTIEADEALLFQNRLNIPFQRDPGETVRFACPPLPAPLHVAAALLRFPGLPLRDRWAGLRIGPEFLRRRRHGTNHLDLVTAADWLIQAGQTPATIQRIWAPICLAALNLPPEKGSAKLFANVLVETFCKSRQETRLGWAREGFGTLCDVQARRIIEQKHGSVLTRTRVTRLLLCNGRAAGVEVHSGRTIEADAVISTAPPWQLGSLLRSSRLAERPEWTALSRFEPSPILALNVWLDREITGEHFVHLDGKRFHWLFDNRRHLAGGSSAPCYSLLISGPTPLIDQSKESLQAIAREDLLDLFPQARDARILRVTVSRQRHATYAPYPGLETFRPGPESPIPGLYLAGDWTATGLPGTLESASRSAEAAVALLG